MKLRNNYPAARDALSWLGAVVQPDEVVEVPQATVDEITAGRLLVDLSTWTVVEGFVPPPPDPPGSSAVQPAPPADEPVELADDAPSEG